MSDEVRINGNQLGWGSAKLKIEGTPYTGITAIEYNDGVEVSHAYGMGVDHAPRGMTAGKYTPEPFVLTCWASTAKAIRADIAARAQPGRGLSSVRSSIILQYIEPDDAVVTVEVIDARLVKNEASNEESPDGLSEKLTFAVMRYVRDGHSLHATERTA